jgi:hypothetical protein
MVHRLAVLLILCATLVLAGAPLATVTNSGGLALNGTKLAVSGVSSWPLVPGDSLATSTSAAVILFPDKSRFAVEKNSRVKLEREGDKVLVRLLEGALAYRLVAGSRVQLVALGRPVTSQGAGEGKVSIVGNKLVEGAVPEAAYSALDCCPPPPTPSKFR